MKILIFIMTIVSIVSCSEKNTIDNNSTNIEIDGYFKHESSPRQHRFSIKNDTLIVRSIDNDSLNEKGKEYQLTDKTVEILNNPPNVLLNQNKTLGKGSYGRYYIFTFHHNTKYSMWKIDVMYKFTDENYLNYLKNILENAYNEDKLKELKIIKSDHVVESVK